MWCCQINICICCLYNGQLSKLAAYLLDSYYVHFKGVLPFSFIVISYVPYQKLKAFPMEKPRGQKMRN